MLRTFRLIFFYYISLQIGFAFEASDLLDPKKVLNEVTFGAFENSYTCYPTEEKRKEALNRIQTQVLCSNSDSLEDCRAQFLPYTETFSTEIKTCSSSNTYLASLVPLPATSAVIFKDLLVHVDQTRTQRKFVRSVAEFHHHMSMHKKRVEEMAVALIKEFPDEFKGIDEAMVRRVMSQHDNAKIDPKFRYKNGKTFIEALYDYYGKRPPREIVDALNFEDKRIMGEALDKEGLKITSHDTFAEKKRKLRIRKAFKTLEDLPDFTDRYLDGPSREEYGRAGYSVADGQKTEIRKKMALFLEHNYKKINQGLEYFQLTPKQHAALLAKLNLDKRLHALRAAGHSFKNMSSSTMKGITATVNRMAQSGVSKGVFRFLLAANVVVDGILLATYSTPIGCNSALGFHDWEIIDGKCTPVSGVTEKIVEYLYLPEEKQKSYLNEGSALCQIMKENDEANQGNIFTGVSCSPDGAKLSLGDNRSINVKYNLKGKISKINLNQMRDIIPGVLGKDLTDVHYNEAGEVTKLCRKVKRKNSQNHCVKSSDGIFSNTKNVRNYLSSMSYKIYQAVSCCLGENSNLNQKIACNI